MCMSSYRQRRRDHLPRCNFLPHWLLDVESQKARHGQEDDVFLRIVATAPQEGGDARDNLVISCLQ